MVESQNIYCLILTIILYIGIPSVLKMRSEFCQVYLVYRTVRIDEEDRDKRQVLFHPVGHALYTEPHGLLLTEGLCLT